MPPTTSVFPWLHGLHQDNHLQLAFFAARRAMSRQVPRCLRGLTVVKAGGDLASSRLKGAIRPDEILPPLGIRAFAPCFQDANPRIGFSVRNFHIQPCKMALVSDVVVYGDDRTPKQEVEDLAKVIATAQTTLRDEALLNGDAGEEFNTFLVTDPFHVFEANHKDVVASDSIGNATGLVMDFLAQERHEMRNLSKPSEIVDNMWLGPTPDPAFYRPSVTTPEGPHYDIMVEASDVASIPSKSDLSDVGMYLLENEGEKVIAHLEFPSSGSFAAVENGYQDEAEVEAILRFFHWLHDMSKARRSDNVADDASSVMRHARGRRILIHCQDGYTESTLLAIGYSMFADGLPAHDAWLRLHTTKQRDFFAYPADKCFLENIQMALLQESPALASPPVLIERPLWMRMMDASLPSRILPYLYLGNLPHAQNPSLLRHLGITRVLSVGEPISWHPDDIAHWGPDNFMYIGKVQDNGVDSLTSYFEQCLEFIADGRQQSGATLVHCRVGVSRSATICIAEVMSSKKMAFPQAYCFVRARRLNVIIQPHLRFTYELMKYEEELRTREGLPLRRGLEWATVAREIAAMNRPYCRQ